MYIHKERAIFLQWDQHKSTQNIKKHGVAFDEAATVIFDENALEYYDQEHSTSEDRFWIIGRSLNDRILFVVYSIRRILNGKENYYRLVSARIANKKERQIYGP
jgi:uncharacterized DUF497 family protein